MQIMLRTRDNGKRAYSYEKLLDINMNVEHNLLILRQMGIYANRQYEISFTDDEQSIGIVTVEEEAEIIR